MEIIRACSSRSSESSLYFCTQGSRWIFREKAYFIFLQNSELSQNENSPCRLTREDRKFRVVGSLSHKDYMVNIGVNMRKTGDVEDILLWIQIYMGPGFLYHDLQTPKGNFEAPF